MKFSQLQTLAISLFFAVSALAVEPPGAVLDLSRWRLTLPIDTEREGKPDEVGQPDLKTFVDPRYFYTDERATSDRATGERATGERAIGVVFRAHCGGRTTKGSKFPRSELREMSEGRKQASWKTDDNAIHTMTMKAAIIATPAVKPHVVCAQIHDAEDDLMMIRLEGTKLFVERNSTGDVMLDRQYKLGTPFDIKIQAAAGKVNVWHNDQPSLTWDVSRSGCYFKAGCYTQSNPSKGDDKESFAEVVIYKLQVEHKPQ